MTKNIGTLVRVAWNILALANADTFFLCCAFLYLVVFIFHLTNGLIIENGLIFDALYLVVLGDAAAFLFFAVAGLFYCTVTIVVFWQILADERPPLRAFIAYFDTFFVGCDEMSIFCVSYVSDEYRKQSDEKSEKPLHSLLLLISLV